MKLFWAMIFLFIGKAKSDDEPENATDVMERTDTYRHVATDFRCFMFALKDLNLEEAYPTVRYRTIPTPQVAAETIGCLTGKVGKKYRIYPPLAGRDPMMEFYIGQLYAGIELATTEEQYSYSFSGGITPLTRRKGYCNGLKRMVSAFPEYWETFHSEDNTCMQIMEIVKSCRIFRQIRESYMSKLSEKLCLDEDGCYNIMEYYAEDLPYCVKHTAIRHFKNASVGTWHHSIINYCHLREMVPEVKEAKYEQSILKGKSKGDLTKMCLYLRHRLLPEEGKETEMPDPDTLDYPDDTTTAEYRNGVPDVASFLTITFVINCFLCTPHKYNQGSSTN